VTRLGMFPLGTVLFPHAVLPLHVFEERYRVLMRDCISGEPQFGVVLIERGSEVGGHDVRFTIGTVARIVEAVELADGRWVLTVVGTRRVRIEEWLPDDPYPVADVRELAEPAWQDADEARRVAAEAETRRALAFATELGETVVPATFELAADPAVAAWQLAVVAPLGPVDKQRLLEIEDHGERLAVLAGLARDEAEVLAYRLSGG